MLIIIIKFYDFSIFNEIDANKSSDCCFNLITFKHVYL